MIKRCKITEILKLSFEDDKISIVDPHEWRDTIVTVDNNTYIIRVALNRNGHYQYSIEKLCANVKCVKFAILNEGCHPRYFYWQATFRLV
mgnify:CR=1 FL=1